MSSETYKIVNVKRVCLKPIDDKKGETILDRLKPIYENPKLEFVRIGILAGAKDENPKFDTYEEVKIRIAFSSKNPRTLYGICEDSNKMKNTKKITWTEMHRLINGLEKGIKEHPELRFYIDYLLILDKGTVPNNAYVIIECKKIDGVASDSPVGIMLHPEIKPVDVITLYSIDIKKNWDKRGFWVKHKTDKIENIYKNYKDYSFAEAKWVKTHTRNLFYSDVFMVRGCDAKEYILPTKVYESLPDGKCYVVNKDSI